MISFKLLQKSNYYKGKEIFVVVIALIPCRGLQNTPFVLEFLCLLSSFRIDICPEVPLLQFNPAFRFILAGAFVDNSLSQEWSSSGICAISQPRSSFYRVSQGFCQISAEVWFEKMLTVLFVRRSDGTPCAFRCGNETPCAFRCA